MAKLYMIGEYRLDGQPRLGIFERAWVSKEGINCICLKILDHYEAGTQVYRTYHEDKLTLLSVVDDTK